ITEPDWVTELDAITVINCGMLLGGPELLPGLLVHVPPQAGGFVLVEFAKPLKLRGASSLLSEFNRAHCAPQNVTWLPTTALRSPPESAMVSRLASEFRSGRALVLPLLQ